MCVVLVGWGVCVYVCVYNIYTCIHTIYMCMYVCMCTSIYKCKGMCICIYMWERPFN